MVALELGHLGLRARAEIAGLGDVVADVAQPGLERLDILAVLALAQRPRERGPRDRLAVETGRVLHRRRRDAGTAARLPADPTCRRAAGAGGQGAAGSTGERDHHEDG